MKNATIFIVLVVVIILGAIGYLLWQNGQPKQAVSQTTATTTTTSTASTASSKIVNASIVNFNFSPGTLRIAKGTKVIWTNIDSTSHTVTSDSGAFDSGTMRNGSTFEFTFNDAGEFPYHCTMHPSMQGKIIVE